MILKLLKRFWEFIKSIWHKLTANKKDAVDAAPTPVEVATPAAVDAPATPSQMESALAKKEYLINFKEKQSFTYQEMLRWGREGFKHKAGARNFAHPSCREIAANFKITYNRMKNKSTSEHEMTNLLDKVIKQMASSYEDAAKNISSAAKGQ